MVAITSGWENKEIEICFINEYTDKSVSKCDLHLSSLGIGLALSLVQRRKKGNVVNAWLPFLDLFDMLKMAVKYVFD